MVNEIKTERYREGVREKERNRRRERKRRIETRENMVKELLSNLSRYPYCR